MSTKGSASRYRSKTVSRQPSQLFVGSSVPSQLRNSSYGRFHEYIKQSGIQASMQQDFQLPRVIVVGGRSAGKSSLLESITKCPIFPRHQDFCTKMPIVLHMTNDPLAIERQVTISHTDRQPKRVQEAHEILAEVNAIMHSVSEVDDKPINIEIRQADIPTLEFVDLPGIQTYPEQREKATTDLVNTYLNKPNTLVLCVVEATTAAFDTSVALKLVRQANKLSNTIVALTKSDLVNDEEEYVPKIFDRILGESSDNDHLRELAGCVAVANRQQRNDKPFTEADAAERQVFSAMLQDPAEAFAAPARQRRLKDNMTVRQLIVQLDRMFHSYIVEHWKPAALLRLAQVANAARGDLSSLGPPVEQLIAEEVMQAVLQQIDCGEVCEAVKANLMLVLAGCKGDFWTSPDHWPKDWQSVPWGSMKWVKLVARARSQHEAVLQKLSQQQHCLAPIVSEVCRIFAKDMRPKLQRFPVLLDCMTAQLLPALTTAVFTAIQPELELLLKFSVQQLYASDLGEAQLPDRLVVGCILSHFISTLEQETLQPQRLQLPADFQLEEAPAVQERRAALHAEIERLELAQRQISNIEDAFSTPESPPAALAAQITAAFGPADAAEQHAVSPSAAASGSGQEDLPVSTKPAPLPNPAAVNIQLADGYLAASDVHAEPDGKSAAAAEIEAELEDVPVSPAASVAESFVHVSRHAS